MKAKMSISETKDGNFLFSLYSDGVMVVAHYVGREHVKNIKAAILDANKVSRAKHYIQWALAEFPDV